MLRMIILIILCIGFHRGSLTIQAQEVTEKFKLANSLLDLNPDSSLLLYTELLPQFQADNDSARQIRCHIGISDVFKNKGQFGSAYDHIWDALLLAEEFKDNLLLIEVHEDVGGLYGILNKYEEAEVHFHIAMHIAKGLIDSGDLREQHLVNLYYSMAVINRKADRYQAALAYIDSCLALDEKLDLGIKDAGYLDAELGRNYLHMNRLKLAEEYLDKANGFFKERNLHYEIMTSLFLGDLHAEIRSWKKAEQYYSRSLQLISIHNSHSDVSREALQKLSVAQNHLGKSKDAYTNLELAFSISDSLYNSGNSLNSDLFQIKNKYADELREKNRQILEQTAELNRQRLVQTRLRMLIASILFLVIAAFGLLRYRFRMRKISLEKQQLTQKAKLKLEKAKAVTEVKTRELTASALQMIEKDKYIEELLKELEASSSTSYSAMASKIHRSNKDMWQEFNMRFTEVNIDFYSKLREHHPELTPTEQKHCALIRLNFSSKEMAELLNISVNSVHISRHRIRKKCGLEREHNLSNYIADITGLQA